MRAIVVHALGAPEVLRLEDVPTPEPGDGEVLVRLHTVGVNFSDTERRRGLYANLALPWRPGNEGAGIVERLGPGTDAAWLGRRVAFWAMPPAVSGAYAELVAVPQDALFSLPDTISFEQGAALPLQGLTAWGLVHLAARPRAGEVALVHAAGGGVGLLAVQLLRAAGVRVLGTVSNEEKSAAVRDVGGEPFAYGADLAERIRAATAGRGVDVVLDSVGRDTQRASLDCLAPLGRLVFFGEASGPATPIDIEQLYVRSLAVAAYSLAIDDTPLERTRASRELIAAVVSGDLRIRIAAVLPLAAAAEAHRRLESRLVTGKLLLNPRSG